MVEVREFWTVNHAKALFLMSKFAQAAVTAEDAESWIRQIPLLVMLYEGVTAGVLDFDYAPASVLISQVRLGRVYRRLFQCRRSSPSVLCRCIERCLATSMAQRYTGGEGRH